MSSTVGLRNVTFDDRDTNTLQYQGSWFNQGTWNASSVGETGTLSSTNDVNANVTFTFPTPAVAFYYYGIPRSRGGSYGICIDCDPNNRIFLPIDGVNTTDNGQNPPIVLFSMNFKTPGVHEVILRNQADPRFNGNSQLTLDRFDLEVVDPNAGSSSSSSSSSSSTASSSTSSTSNTAEPAVAAGSSSSTPVGAIVGGVLGGLAAILAIIILLFWLRTRKRKATLVHPPDQESEHHPYSDRPPSHSQVIQPFAYPAMQESSSGRTGASVVSSGGYGISSGKGAPLVSRHPQFQPSISTFSDVTSAGQSSSGAPASTSTQPTFSSVVSGPRREQDGGPLPLPVEEEEDQQDTLPPEYGTVFASRRATIRRGGGDASAAEPDNSGSLSPVRRKS
ncbi:hypothetical protein D9613_003516 [Agrocybe pediades]|uniref:Uncharacterized protein n=1 Tax=Agrocybe pediades TaxID=84607 RepID=A0A8H4QPV3_9AGAR|nr:hypothetical protein D9613_003516 [Agrocybe pediades]